MTKQESTDFKTGLAFAIWPTHHNKMCLQDKNDSATGCLNDWTEAMLNAHRHFHGGEHKVFSSAYYIFTATTNTHEL